MSKQKLYLLVGLTWLLCCVYQLKNGNMFMVVVSAIISVLLFALAIYNKFKSKESKSGDKTEYQYYENAKDLLRFAM